MTRSKKPTELRQYTSDNMPIAFHRRYVVFMRHTKPIPGVTLPVIGISVADNRTLARQQFARERDIDEKYLFLQAWHDALASEREEAQEKQAEWEAQQREDQGLLGKMEEEMDRTTRVGLANAHISDIVQREPARRKELLSLYDRTVKILREDGYLD